MSSPSAAPSPRLTAKGRATRERIVREAAALVLERGVARTSIDDVRRAAGVSGSQISHYFADKQALMRAVVEHEAQDVLDRQSPPFDRLDGFAALEAWVQGAIRQQSRTGCVGGCSFGSLASELAETDDETRAGIAGGFSAWGAKIEDGLEAMRDRGELRADADPHALALAVLAALQGGLLMTQSMRDTAPLEAAMDAVLAHVRTFAA